MGQPVTNGRRLVRPAAILQLTIHPELKEMIGRDADEKGLSMNEWVALMASKIFRRPDLAAIPRKPMGRPRKAISA